MICARVPEGRSRGPSQPCVLSTVPHIIPKCTSAKIRIRGFSGLGFDGSGATPGWWADVLWVVGIRWFEGLLADAKMVFVGCEPVQENVSARRMENAGGTMKHDEILSPFSTLFPFLFLISFAGVMELWCFWLFVLLRLCFQEWSPLSLSVLDDLEIPQRRGLECHCDIPRWPAVQPNANRVSFFFGRERPRMPARRRLNSSSVRALRSAGVINRY